MSQRYRVLIALAAGLLLPCAFAPLAWWPVALISLGTLFAILNGVNAKQAAALGWVFGLGYFGAGVYWVYISTHIFGGAPVVLAVFLAVLLVSYLALYPALVAWFSNRFERSSIWQRAVLFSAGWALAEMLRGWLLTGFPWLAVGYTQLNTPLLTYAPVLGVYGISLILVATAASLVAIFSSRQRLVGAIVITALWIFGGSFANKQWSEPLGEPVAVATVQGNVSQDKKWDPAWFGPTLNRYRQMSMQQEGVELMLWPEAAIPAYYHEVARDYFRPLNGLLAARGTSVITGVITQDKQSLQASNSLVQIDAGGRERFYHKTHLVPFGEFFPVPDFVRELMNDWNLPYSDIKPGEPGQLPFRLRGEIIAASICFEDVFPEELALSFPAAKLLVNVSNDAWFGGSSAAHQHLEMARMRSAEVARYQLRATNTGLSAVIGPRGELLEQFPQFERGVLRGEVKLMSGSTPYAQWRNWPVIFICLLLILLSLAWSKLYRQTSRA